MKRMLSLKRILLYCLIVTNLGFGCKKSFLNKRHKFIGDYTFDVKVECSPNWPCDTTFTSEGFVDYSDDPEKLIIVYGGNYTLEPRIDDDYNLIQSIDHYQTDSIGRFINKDEVEFYVRTGGLGAWCYENVYGKKK